MTLSLRKRHQDQPSLSAGGAQQSSRSKRRRKLLLKRQNYGQIFGNAVIFLSSPLLLLLILKYSSTPRSNRQLNTPPKQQQSKELPYFKQQQQAKLHLRTFKREEEQNGIQDLHVVFQIRNNTTSPTTVLSSSSKIPIVVWPYTDYGAGTAELLHFGENGIQESAYVEMSDSIDNYSPNVVWIGDYGFAFKPSTWCDAFLEKIVEARQERSKRGLLTLEWPILIVDWSDTTHTPRCTQIEQLMGSEWVHYFIRNIVTGRRWNATKEWVDVGELVVALPSPNYHHVPLFVRTDTVQVLESVLLQQQEYNGINLSSPIETAVERSVDVSHFWPLDGNGVKETKHAKLRTKVSEVITELGTSANISTFVGLAGSALQWGRRNVKTAYIQAMLDSKIIVVSQRDDWEDHYRLFEALVSGAMVMTDRMLSLPHGLENGVSIVEYTSEDDLRTKILYYLKNEEERFEIARKGRLVSMSQHRTWHRVEQVVFGRELSNCDSRRTSTSTAGRHERNCPWVVHPSEA